MRPQTTTLQGPGSGLAKAALGLLVLAAGCASRPPCDSGTIEAAVAAGLDQGLAPEFVELTGCRVQAQVLDQAWQSRACTAEGAWRLGLADGELPPSCDRSDRWLREGYNLGLEYRRIRLLLSESGGQGLDAVRYTREIDAIVGVARIKGWPVPESQGELP